MEWWSLIFGILMGGLLLLVILRFSLRPLRQAVQSQSSVALTGGMRCSLLGLTSLGHAYNDLLQTLQRQKGDKNSQLLKIETVLSSMREGALIIDETHEVVMANPAFSRMLGIEQEVVGERLEYFLYHGEFLDYLKLLEQGEEAKQREIEIPRGEEILHLEVSGSRFTPPGSVEQRYVIIVLHDITHQKRLEKVRKDFVANVSHELRTPLTIIKGYADTLLDGQGSVSFEDQTRFIQKIASNTNRLHLLLEDLMSLSRLESSKVTLRCELTDLNRLITEISSEFGDKMNPRGHQIVLDLDETLPSVRIDSVKITQVLENLLDNAFKYSPDRSLVHVKSAQDEERVHITVQDNGKGIPAEDLTHVFERFYRVDKGRSRVDGGTGLGLSIVRHILLLHQGEIRAESDPGKGTRIVFSLSKNLK